MKNIVLSFAILGVSITTSALASSATLQSQIGPSVWVQNNTVKLIEAEITYPNNDLSAVSFVGILPFQSARLPIPSGTYSVGVCWADNLSSSCSLPQTLKSSITGLYYPEVSCPGTVSNPTSVYVIGSEALYDPGTSVASPTLVCAKQT